MREGGQGDWQMPVGGSLDDRGGDGRGDRWTDVDVVCWAIW